MSVYNKEDLLRHLNQIKPSGYEMNTYGQYIKQMADRKIVINFGIQEYFPHDVSFYAFGGGVSLTQVETILKASLNT